MTTDERLGTFEGILKPHVSEIQAIARALRTLMETVHPESVETPRIGEKCTTYGVGPRKMTEAYAHIMPLTASVNLGFYHGIALPDPAGLLEGTGKAARHAKVRTMAEARSPAVKALIKAAVKERATAVAGLKKKGG